MSSELSRTRATLQSIRNRGKDMEQTIVRKAVIVATSAATGFAESKGLAPAYFGVPTKLGLGALATLAQLLTRDRSTNRLLGAFSDAQLANYTYAASKSHAFIAGEGGSL